MRTFFLFIVISASALAGTIGVFKSNDSSTRNQITEDLIFASGKTLSGGGNFDFHLAASWLVPPQYAVPSAIGNTNKTLQSNGSIWVAVTGGGGGGTPGGSSGDWQYNTAGVFGGFTPAAGAQTFVTTPTSANLRSLLTDESGTGAAIFAGGNIGAAAATSINGISLTSGTGTLTLGSVTLNAGSGGTLGSNAFTSTAYVPTNTTVNGHPLTSNIAVTPTDLSLVIGSNTEAWAANLDTWATKTPYAGSVIVASGKTATISNTLTFTGSDSASLNIGSGGALAALAFASVAPAGTLTGNTLNASVVNSSLASVGALTSGSIGTGFTAIPNSALSNSSISIAGTPTSLGGSITLDTLTGLSAVGLVKRTGANAEGIAIAGTDYLSPSTGVSSIVGTANQINATASVGAVALSLPTALIGLTSITAPVAGNIALFADNGNGTNIQLYTASSNSMATMYGSNTDLANAGMAIEFDCNPITTNVATAAGLTVNANVPLHSIKDITGPGPLNGISAFRAIPGSGTDGNVAFIRGYMVRDVMSSYLGTGTVTKSAGFVSEFPIVGNSSDTPPSVAVTEYSGLLVKAGTVTYGTLANYYGIYIENNTSAVNNWSIYNAGGKIFSGDSTASTSVATGAIVLNNNIGLGGDGNAWFTGKIHATTITGLSSPASGSDGANKAYVDAQLKTFDLKDPCAASTTGALPFSPTYSNGSSGAGATLTGTVGILAFDSYTPVLGDRLLVKNQASTFQNGIYTLTTVGTVVVGYVLTRATDFDVSADIIYGSTTLILNGTANANQQFTMSNNATITVGTTAITFAQTSGGSQLIQGTGITITGNTVAVDTAVTATASNALTLTGKSIDAGQLTGTIVAARIPAALAGINSVTSSASTALAITSDTAITHTSPLNSFNSAAGTTPFTELEIDSTVTSSPRGIMSAQFNTGTDGARFHFRKARGTRASPTTVISGDNLGRLVGTGYDGTGYLEMASIYFATQGTIATNRVPTNIQFWTATDAAPSVLTEAGRFTALQNLLIGGTTDITGSGGLKVFGATASSSTTTGSLINAGGFGNSGDASIGGNVTVTGKLVAGSGPTTLTDSAGKVLSASLNTVAVANGGTAQTSWTDGQLPIGNTTGNTLTPGTITAGTGITVTNGHGTITVAATGAAVDPWLVAGTIREIASIGTTLHALGINNSTAGTGSTQTATTTLGTAVRYATAASTNSDAGWSGNGNVTNFGLLPKVTFRCQLTDFSLGVQRDWIGLTTSGTQQKAADNPGASASFAAFRYSTGASDTNWQCCTSEGTTMTITDSGIAVSAAAVKLQIEILSSSVKFYIGGTLVATNTTHLPTGACAHLINCRTLENVAKNIDMSQIVIDEP